MRSVFDVRNEIAFIPTSPLLKQEPCRRRCLDSCSHLSIPLETASQILRRLHLKNKRFFSSEFLSPRWHQYSLPRIRFLRFVTRFFRYIRCSKIELNLHISIFFSGSVIARATSPSLPRTRAASRTFIFVIRSSHCLGACNSLGQ